MLLDGFSYTKVLTHRCLHAWMFHTQMPWHADAFTHRNFYAQKVFHAEIWHTDVSTQWITLKHVFIQAPFHTAAGTDRNLAHTATCANRKFLNTEISPIDVSTRRHFAQRGFCTQQLLHTNIFLHRCFCPLQDFTCKKMFLQTNVFILRSSSHRSGNNAWQKKLRWYRLCIFLSSMRFFSSRDPAQRSHRFSQKIFCRGLSRRSCAELYTVHLQGSCKEAFSRDPCWNRSFKSSNRSPTPESDSFPFVSMEPCQNCCSVFACLLTIFSSLFTKWFRHVPAFLSPCFYYSVYHDCWTGPWGVYLL